MANEEPRIIAVKIDFKYVYYKTDDGAVSGEKITEENKDYWLDLYCKLQNY